jgi:hypothetical protein
MKMKTYAELAGIVASAYKSTPTISVDDNVRAVRIDTADEVIIAIPGTTDLAGWMRDISAWPEWFTGVGPCHEGFGSGGIKLHRAIARRRVRSNHGGAPCYVASSAVSLHRLRIAARRYVLQSGFRAVRPPSDRASLIREYRRSGSDGSRRADLRSRDEADDLRD